MFAIIDLSPSHTVCVEGTQIVFSDTIGVIYNPFTP